MASSLGDGNLPGEDMVDLQDCFDDPAMSSLMRIDSTEKNLSVNLDAVGRSMLRFLSASPTSFLEDKALIDLLPLASSLLIEVLNK